MERFASFASSGKRGRMLDLDDFPPGTLARTPSGRVGIVIKHQGAASKLDHFQRVVLHFSADPRDSVMLQPHMLEPITPCTRAQALTPEARAFWDSPEGEALMDKMRNRCRFTEAERESLERVMRGEPYRPAVSEVSKRVSVELAQAA